MGTTGQFELVN